MSPFISKYVSLILQSVNPVPVILALVKSVFSKSHFSKIALSKPDSRKLTPDKLQKTKTELIKSHFSKPQLLKSKFLLSVLLPIFNFWKMQFSATASPKLQFVIEALPKSKKLNFVPGNLQLEKPMDSKLLSEKSQELNLQLLKFVNLKFNSTNLQDSKIVSAKSFP